MELQKKGDVHIGHRQTVQQRYITVKVTNKDRVATIQYSKLKYAQTSPMHFKTPQKFLVLFYQHKFTFDQVLVN